MLSSPIEFGISTIGASALTDVFLIILVFSFALSAYWKKNDKHAAFTQYTPTLLTSLGILGTFMGIVAGLLEFNTADIDKSIGPLLDGLKTAFITSLSGMLLSIIYKGLGASGLLAPKTDEQSLAADDVTGADLYQVMSKQAETLTQLKQHFCEGDSGSINDLYHLVNKQATSLEKIQTAIGGDNESSMVGQFKLMRSDINDNQRRSEKHLESSVEALTEIKTVLKEQQEHFVRTEKHMEGSFQKLLSIQNALVEQQNNFGRFEDRLWIKLQEFADMMSKSATEQVIDALKTVIQDFNNKLTEQFGENFKQLNTAVGELVTWQENYKQQLVEMKVQYDQGVQAITQTETSVAHIEEKAQAIPVAMDTLVKVMEVNQHQIDELTRHLGAFEQVRDKAVEAVPEIRQQIDMAIAGARLANEEMAKGVQESSEQLKVVVLESAENYRDAVDRTRGALDDAATTTANCSVEIKDQFTAVISDINNNMRNLVDELQTGGKELNKSYINAGEKLVENIEASSKAVNDSYIKAGEKLASDISNSAEEINTGYRKVGEQMISDIKDSGEAFNHSFKELSSSLITGAESMNSHFVQTGEKFVANLQEGGQALNKSYQQAGEQLASDIKNSGDNLNNAYKELSTAYISDTENMSRQFRKGVEEMQNTLANTIQEQAQAHRQQADSIFASLDKAISNALSDTGESVEKQINMIDQTMGQEIDKVMQAMGSALASISGQFTSDYTKLVRQMQQITREIA